VVTIPHVLTLTLGPVPWLVGGAILLAFNLFIPSPVVASLGVAGLLTALVALNVPAFPSQLLVWGILSAGFTLVLRGLVPQESKALEPSRYARVCEQIPPGGIGRVHYEGAIWHARCQISDAAIAPESSVVVVDRQGNTLIVSPLPTSPFTNRQTD